LFYLNLARAVPYAVATCGLAYDFPLASSMLHWLIAIEHTQNNVRRAVSLVAKAQLRVASNQANGVHDGFAGWLDSAPAADAWHVR
jgi:hypothetical protein